MSQPVETLGQLPGQSTSPRLGYTPLITSPVVSAYGDQGLPRAFACPFYKFNPALCDECKKFQFMRISDVKQHIVRCHSYPEDSAIACAACHATFVDEQSRIIHLSEGNCHIVAAPERLSPQEVTTLKETKFPRGHSSVSQWFAIWNQLFTGHAQPQSPYKESNNIKEVISLISPSVESYLYATFPTVSRQHQQSQISPVRMMMDSVCRDFCDSLPISRYGSARLDSVSRDRIIASPSMAVPQFGSLENDATAAHEGLFLGDHLKTLSTPIDTTSGFEPPGIMAADVTELDITFSLHDALSPLIPDYDFGVIDANGSVFDQFLNDHQSAFEP
ncbi:unnamed protein product [Clonostachys rosea]|uniref:C2H2-type domain-containing protein n=1 Tax=Bionectria ochroleuca TaxID=29856 RepID=A0ABY6U232_BIOOC|nr:unnamed protein product [Clonostachys rosea]